MDRLCLALLAAAAAVTLAGCPVSSPRPQPTCAGGEVVCGGSCRAPSSFASDPQNCGACGVRCGIGTCTAGACNCEGATLCAGQIPRCADTQNDPAHCGGCDTPCTEAGAQCQGGACGCYAPRADDCGTVCTDWLTDPQHCGTDASACGHSCPLTNDVCVAGTCECPASLPDVCGSSCVDILTDPSNCGTPLASACGHACPLTNDVCVAGTCRCPAALPDVCGSTCVSILTDPSNCGTPLASACGHACATGATCAAGQCHCPGTTVVCSGACVDRQTDEANCGTCGNACPPTATCQGGSCTCPAAAPVQCGTGPGTCCAGGCCGAACETAHANGLGQTYYDCGALDAHTQTQASLAADAWSPTGNTVDQYPSCGVPDCLCRELGTSVAAVWCYGTTTLSGRVRLTTNVLQGCTSQAAVCPFTADDPAWH